MSMNSKQIYHFIWYFLFILFVKDLLASNAIVATLWRSQKHVQLLLSNCVLLSIQVASHSGDIDRLVIDKSLQGKVPPSINHGKFTNDIFHDENCIVSQAFKK